MVGTAAADEAMVCGETCVTEEATPEDDIPFPSTWFPTMDDEEERECVTGRGWECGSDVATCEAGSSPRCEVGAFEMEPRTTTELFTLGISFFSTVVESNKWDDGQRREKEGGGGISTAAPVPEAPAIPPAVGAAEETICEEERGVLVLRGGVPLARFCVECVMLL